MLCQTHLLIPAMILVTIAIALFGLFLLLLHPSFADSLCPDGRSCPDFWRCCEHGCCAPSTFIAQSKKDHDMKENVFTHEWYWNWPIIFLAVTLTSICVCVAWCLCFRTRSRHCSCWLACCVRRSTSNHDSSGSCYPPPHYSRCGSFHQAPPPYSEVTSKPDMYPLVITYGEGDSKNSGNYLMVHYFRNYVIRPPGSLSATSTAESLNSSFICNAANEANSVIPPPYSCASNYPEWGGLSRGSLLRSLSSLTDRGGGGGGGGGGAGGGGGGCGGAGSPPARRQLAPRSRHDISPEDVFRQNLITSPVQPVDSSYDLELELIDYELHRDTGRKPRLGTSPTTFQRCQSNDDNDFESDNQSIRHRYALDPIVCESPPQPTSPTQTSRESTLRRPTEERYHRRPEVLKYNPKTRKSSLYMPLTSAYPGRPSRISPGAREYRASSRSAPVTPCGSLVPNLFALSQRVSSSRHGSRSSKLEEENDPLLSDDNGSRPDHKF